MEERYSLSETLTSSPWVIGQKEVKELDDGSRKRSAASIRCLSEHAARTCDKVEESMRSLTTPAGTIVLLPFTAKTLKSCQFSKGAIVRPGCREEEDVGSLRFRHVA